MGSSSRRLMCNQRPEAVEGGPLRLESEHSLYVSASGISQVCFGGSAVSAAGCVGLCGCAIVLHGVASAIAQF